MESVIFNSQVYKMSNHAQERVAARFAELDLQAVFSRSKMMNELNKTHFGEAMRKKFHGMKDRFPASCKLVVNTYFNTAFAVCTENKVVITAMYADGTWSYLD